MQSEQTDTHSFKIVSVNKIRAKIRATEATLKYLADDAEYQIGDRRDVEASTIRTNTTFIQRVQEALKAVG